MQALKLVALALGAAAIGFFVGSWQAGPIITTGTAQAADNAILVDADDWTYEIPLDITWVDDQNTWHHGERPACLPPSESPIGALRFAYANVSIDGSSWRQVVWVDCRNV